jgi:putative membrane protein
MKTNYIFLVLLLFFYALTANAEDKLTDGEIAQILLTANSIDVGNGELAKDRATNADVKNFAQRMVNDHNDNNKKVQELLKKINLDLEDNKISQKLTADAGKALNDLKDLNKEDFDKRYIKAEIELHEQVIDLAESKLVPNVKNQELKSLLEKTHPILKSHLEHAKRVLESLNK